ALSPERKQFSVVCVCFLGFLTRPKAIKTNSASCAHPTKSPSYSQQYMGESMEIINFLPVVIGYPPCRGSHTLRRQRHFRLLRISWTSSISSFASVRAVDSSE